MRGRQISEQRWWKIFLLIHLICYEIFFLYALFDFTMWYSPQREFAILLLWTPALLIHVAATYYQIGRGEISKVERDAYREGIADAMKQLGAPAERIERLALDDEGELVELPKRKRDW